jgi:hypothetical protein
MWLEDDWGFTAGGFLGPSFEISEKYPEVITVALRGDWNHPLVSDKRFPFKIAQPNWKGGWGGFCFNPGARRRADWLRVGSYGKVAASLEEYKQAYRDLKDDRLETYELQLDENPAVSLELYPFIIIKTDRLHYYNRTKPDGYEYCSVLGATGHFVPTKRKFSHASLHASIATDLQGLFWTQVTPTVSSSGVRANIPAHGPIVGRKDQIGTIMDEVIQIPNQNAIVHGPGGVGKTALLIELCKRLFEDGALFKNIIWVSAKRDYYDPTLDVIEPGTPQFECLDNILASLSVCEERVGIFGQ